MKRNSVPNRTADQLDAAKNRICEFQLQFNRDALCAWIKRIQDVQETINNDSRDSEHVWLRTRLNEELGALADEFHKMLYDTVEYSFTRILKGRGITK